MKRPEVPFVVAMKALADHEQANVLWIAKATTLLHMVGEPGIDPIKLAAQCKEHASRTP